MQSEQLFKIVDDVSASFGLSVVATRLTQKGKQRVLEVTIHRPGGRVSLDDCEAVSRKLDTVLDESNPALIAGSFVLEVTSPGLDRLLSTEREFELFTRSPVRVRTKAKLDNFGVSIDAVLEAKLDDAIVLSTPRPTEQTKGSKKKAVVVEYPQTLTVELSKVMDVRLRAADEPFADQASAVCAEATTE